MWCEQHVSKIQEGSILLERVSKGEDDFLELNKFRKLLHLSWERPRMPTGAAEEDARLAMFVTLAEIELGSSWTAARWPTQPGYMRALPKKHLPWLKFAPHTLPWLDFPLLQLAPPLPEDTPLSSHHYKYPIKW